MDEDRSTLHLCQKCNMRMRADQFYTYRDGTKAELCKKCLTMHVDNFDESTFLWILEKMDVPYIPEEWNVIRDRMYARDPNKMNGMTVMGRYLAKMKLKQWNIYRWSDTEKLKREKERKEREEIEEQKRLEDDAKKRFVKGEISEAEYRTLTSTETQRENEDLIERIASYPTKPPTSKKARSPLVISGEPEIGNFYDEKEFMSEDELTDPSNELTDEDKLYLAMKWGRLYKPYEWIELEKKYNEMMNSFDIQDSDTEGTLILICKTYLKMNQAIDCGSMDEYQKLSRVYDLLRKSGKFTAVQNKKEKENCLDSVGELVAYCEKHGGEIPKYKIETDLDTVDVIIKDMKNYTKTLIYEDTALSQQIEDYLKRKEISEDMRRDKEEAKKKGLTDVPVDDLDIQKYYERLEEEKEKDMKVVYEGDDEV